MRQLILDRNISLGEIIPVEGKQYHYLSRVLRLKPGTIIGVSGKDGISGQCLITEVNPVLQTLFLKCLSLKETDTALEITGKTVPINLFIWMVKSHKMEQIIRQAIIPKNRTPNLKPKDGAKSYLKPGSNPAQIFKLKFFPRKVLYRQ